MDEPHGHRAAGDSLPPWHARIRQAVRHRYSTYGEHGLAWRILTPAVFVAAGVLFVTSSISSAGTDLRPGRYDNLADLAASRSDRVEQLNRARSEIQAEVDSLSERLTGTGLDEVTSQVEALRGPFGLEPVSGAGLTVTLDDAPIPLRDETTGEIDAQLVHQQDIQAVVNAMWAGGADAVTIQGVRIVSTTGIKCVGNVVLLEGARYPPPYVISAIGDPDTLRSRLDRDPSVELFLRDAALYGLFFDLEVNDVLEFPAYDGPTEVEYASPLTRTS